MSTIGSFRRTRWRCACAVTAVLLSGLTIEVTEDPSPYDIGARIDADGALIARLSIGYLTMHDAALDAVTLSDALQRPRELRPYLMYQLQLAHDNQQRRARGA